MRKSCRSLIAIHLLISAFCNSALADPKTGTSGVVSTPSPLESQTSNSPNTDRPRAPDCSRPNADPRCPRPQPPYYYPNQYRSHPVIINQTPAEPAIDTNSLTDDWEGCRSAKLGAIRARDNGDTDQANHLDEWLWKNCRSYSSELRQLEQNGM